jgi:hypothetical protein
MAAKARAAVAATKPQELELPPGILGPRYLRYLAGLILLLGIFQRSDLLSVQAVLAVIAGTILVAVVGLALALQRAGTGAIETWRSPDHYLLPVLAIGIGAAVSYLSPDWRLATVSQALAAGVVFASSYVTLERFLGRERPGHEFLHDAAFVVLLLGAFLAILSGIPNLLGKLVLIFVVTFLVAYESFISVVAGEYEALFYSQTVASIATAVAFGLVSASVLGDGYIAVILMLVWYVERGVIVHVLSRTMTRSIMLEYIVMAVVCLVLVANAVLNH